MGLVTEKTEVAYLKSFLCIVVKKTFQVTSSYFVACRHLRDDDFTICPTHKLLGGVVVPIVDVECLERCPAVAMVGLSRFQKPIRELASVYHR